MQRTKNSFTFVFADRGDALSVDPEMFRSAIQDRLSSDTPGEIDFSNVGLLLGPVARDEGNVGQTWFVNVWLRAKEPSEWDKRILEKNREVDMAYDRSCIPDPVDQRQSINEGNVEYKQTRCFYAFLFETEQEALAASPELFRSVIQSRLSDAVSDELLDFSGVGLHLGPPDYDVNFTPSWVIGVWLRVEAPDRWDELILETDTVVETIETFNQFPETVDKRAA